MSLTANLACDALAADATATTLYVGTGSGGASGAPTGSVSGSPQSNGAVTAFTFTLPSAGTYFFRLTQTNATGESAMSNEISGAFAPDVVAHAGAMLSAGMYRIRYR